MSSSSFMLKLWNMIGGSPIRDAKAVFTNCKNRSIHPIWAKRGLIPEDFRSKHTLLLLHIWMVHKRLIQEGNPGMSTQECLFDELWEDTCGRIRLAGIPELSVNKRLTEVQSYSWQCCVELDEAVKPSRTDEEVLDEIGGALWRSVYNRREEVEADHVMHFARYIRNEHQSLMTLSTDSVLTGKFRWGPFPLWPAIETEGALLDENGVQIKVDYNNVPEDLKKRIRERNEWREAMAQDGRPYYWNVRTRETRWEKPKALQT